MIDYEPGNVVECLREHYAFRSDGEIVSLERNELLIIVETDHYQATALRVSTDEHIKIMLLEIPALNSFDASPRTYKKIWP